MKKKKLLIIIIVSVILLSFVGVAVFLFTNSGNKNEDKSYSSDIQKEEPTVTVKGIAENEDLEKEIPQITDDGTGLSPDETKVEEKKTETGSKKSIESAKSVTPSSSHSTEEAKSANGYVQDANPETGISWDGKSHIVYTYLDGTKGSEKKDGAVYEVSPGVTRIYTEKDEEWDGKCCACCKVSGDGKNGTCVRWLMSDMICPNCKEFVKQGECHTCKE